MSTAPIRVSRIAGPDRYAVAARLADQMFLPPVPVVFVASGAGFADALAGGAAAAASDAPVLLVRRTTIPKETAAELGRLAPGRIVVLGGPLTISDQVQQQLGRYTSGPVVRWAGHDRFATASTIATHTYPRGAKVAYVANGEKFADGLAGTPAAAKAGGPILLTLSDRLPKPTAHALDVLGVDRIVILGGPMSVSRQVAAALGRHGAVRRVSGSDRYATAAAISKDAFPGGTHTVLLAAGTAFPDALAGGAVAGGMPEPLLITAPKRLPATIKSELLRLQPRNVIILGGTLSVREAVADQIRGLR